MGSDTVNTYSIITNCGKHGLHVTSVVDSYYSELSNQDYSFIDLHEKLHSSLRYSNVLCDIYHFCLDDVVICELDLRFAGLSQGNREFIVISFIDIDNVELGTMWKVINHLYYRKDSKYSLKYVKDIKKED